MGRRRNSGRSVNGILLLDKPIGITSNRALQIVKRLYGAKKAGHTGSLDPAATGVLPICFGEATKVSSYLLSDDKEYQFVAKLGEATDTGDSDGVVVNRIVTQRLGEDDIARAVAEFLGESEQIPPMYSALKHNGKRLHQLARQGVEVERASRCITIFELSVVEYDHPYLTMNVVCSKGTYVRTLAEDIAKFLRSCAHLTSLRRTQVSALNCEQLVTMGEVEQCSSQRDLDQLLLPMDQPLSDWSHMSLTEREANAFVHGNRVTPPQDYGDGCLVRIYDLNGQFLGIAESNAGELQPKRVINYE